MTMKTNRDIDLRIRLFQIGFNKGDGVSSLELPNPRRSTILDQSNVGHPGVFVYRVDQDRIESCGGEGNCHSYLRHIGRMRRNTCSAR